MANSEWTVSALANRPFACLRLTGSNTNTRGQHGQMQGTGPCRRLGVERVRQTAMPPTFGSRMAVTTMHGYGCNGVLYDIITEY